MNRLSADVLLLTCEGIVPKGLFLLPNLRLLNLAYNHFEGIRHLSWNLKRTSCQFSKLKLFFYNHHVRGDATDRASGRGTAAVFGH